MHTQKIILRKKPFSICLWWVKYVYFILQRAASGTQLDAQETPSIKNPRFHSKLKHNDIQVCLAQGPLASPVIGGEPGNGKRELRSYTKCKKCYWGACIVYLERLNC